MNEEARYQHMIAVETRLQNIEDLLRELVQLTQRAENRDAEDRHD